MQKIPLPGYKEEGGKLILLPEGEGGSIEVEGWSAKSNSWGGSGSGW